MSHNQSRIEHALAVWAEHAREGREFGWPQESSEVRAFWAAQTASIGPGRDNSVRQGVGIPQCKETRPRRSGRVPRIDQARLAPKVGRLLLDMAELGMETEAVVVMATALDPRATVVQLCLRIGIKTKDGRPAVRRFGRLKRRGMAHLEAALSLPTLEERRAIGQSYCSM